MQPAEIIAVAAAQFRARGYAGTSVRAVAAGSGVDPGTVRYRFGSKGGLFAAVMGFETAPAEVLRRAVDGVPEERLAGRLLALVIRSWEDAAATAPLRSAVRSALEHPERAALFRGYVEAEVVSHLAGVLSGPGRRERAAAAVEVVLGLLFARYLLQLPTFASATAQDAYRRTLPALRAALHSPLRCPA